MQLTLSQQIYKYTDQQVHDKLCQSVDVAITRVVFASNDVQYRPTHGSVTSVSNCYSQTATHGSVTTSVRDCYSQTATHHVGHQYTMLADHKPAQCSVNKLSS